MNPLQKHGQNGGCWLLCPLQTKNATKWLFAFVCWILLVYQRLVASEHSSCDTRSICKLSLLEDLACLKYSRWAQARSVNMSDYRLSVTLDNLASKVCLSSPGLSTNLWSQEKPGLRIPEQRGLEVFDKDNHDSQGPLLFRGKAYHIIVGFIPMITHHIPIIWP